MQFLDDVAGVTGKRLGWSGCARKKKTEMITNLVYRRGSGSRHCEFYELKVKKSSEWFEFVGTVVVAMEKEAERERERLDESGGSHVTHTHSPSALQP